ncbi:MAG: DUF480 domain-containing protein [Acidobacteria bacterium]|nr:MAG: DUF480 domain-containing protein [Acidobacteriota bacterium]
MDQLLNETEVRVLGSLIEKEITTPEYYPLSLNALTNACNQSSNRNPVVHFDEETVARAMDSLRKKNLVHVVHKDDSRVTKYRHVMAETIGLDIPEIAVMCVLMLRGPQTVGEIRTRSNRIHDFQDLEEVETTLNALIAREPSALAVRLPRQTGQKEVRYAHLLSGEVALDNPDPAMIRAQADSERIAKLEEITEELRKEVEDLRNQFEQFRKQFE